LPFKAQLEGEGRGREGGREGKELINRTVSTHTHRHTDTQTYNICMRREGGREGRKKHRLTEIYLSTRARILIRIGLAALGGAVKESLEDLAKFL
jgi:hypothetical protein